MSHISFPENFWAVVGVSDGSGDNIIPRLTTIIVRAPRDGYVQIVVVVVVNG
jgi:hypothetical protein